MPSGHNNEDPNVGLKGLYGDHILFEFISQFNPLIDGKIQEVLIEFDTGYPAVIAEFQANIDVSFGK